MIEINNPDIDIDEIKARIEEELQQHRTVPPSPATPTDPTDPAEEKGAKSVSKDYFLQFHDQAFINRAYAAILHRDPDPQGGRFYLEKLSSGELSRVDILGRLRYSREGRRKKVPVKGLLCPFIFHRLFKFPLLGWGLRVVTGVLHLPIILKNVSRLESEFITRTRFMEEKLLSSVSEIREQMDRLEDQVIQARAEHEAKRAESGELIAGLKDQVIQIRAEHEAETAGLSQQIKDHKLTILDMQRKIRMVLEADRERFPEPVSNEAPPHMAKPEAHLLDAMYLDFTNRFRGTEEDIKERVTIYLPYVQTACEKTDNALLLDIGCGRGEWLRVLKENHIAATGLDVNRVMVDKCRNAGLDAVASDALAYLRNRKADTLSVVTGFHIVEHLPFQTMIALFDESLRVLKPGGIVIFETPNPENLMVGAYDFYTDPTHQNPIPPHTLAFLVEARGFVNIETLRLHPNCSLQVGDAFLNHYFTVGQDYAVIGFKA